MSIQVVCPIGHVLKVSDDYAGKTGLCPVCKSRVKVPKPSEDQLSEDAIMSILGKYDPNKARKKLADVSDLAAADTPRALQNQTSPDGGADTVANAASLPKKSCPHCNREIVAGIHICPHCHTYIAGLGDF
ncbi:MAG: hypothetical protein A2V98_03220 [Planctomycetes bacterium RBG_16_64_12]|nr:MAG: hypothetical protein A2V98_03220 [Planctomycetes bacterium RBG_16_64_12]